MQDEVIFTEDNGVGVITLNRPDRLNALTYSMVQKINEKLDSWEINDDINCVIIEGAGDRSFCAGGDVVKLRKEVLADGGPNGFLQIFENLHMPRHEWTKRTPTPPPMVNPLIKEMKGFL